MRRSTRLELERVRTCLLAAQKRRDQLLASPNHRNHARGLLSKVCGADCPLHDEQSTAWREWNDLATARRALLRKIEAEQLELAEKQSAGAAAGIAKIKRKSARTTRKTERVLASLGEKPERRGINKKIAAVAKVSPRTAARHLQKIRKR